jgi:ATP-dependent RNA helicase DHX8/PRP22
VVVLDEAHERSLNTDILFGLLKAVAMGGARWRRRQHRGPEAERGAPLQGAIAAARGADGAAAEPGRDAASSGDEGGGEGELPPLRLVVTSATLESAKFSAYFGGCPVLRVPGRAFPVAITHSPEDHAADYQAAAVDAAMDIHLRHPPGDILVFLTGQAEIERAVRALVDAVRALPPGAAPDLQVLPLYAALPPEMQARVFAPPPPGARRCVVATNVAETSVTVEGVVYVIDPGVVKQKDYNPRTGMDSLGVVPVSRVQATQRAGRAGRTRPGHCFRLYTKKRFEQEMTEVVRRCLRGAKAKAKAKALRARPPAGAPPPPRARAWAGSQPPRRHVVHHASSCRLNVYNRLHHGLHRLLLPPHPPAPLPPPPHPPQTPPEIRRTSLVGAVLYLKSLPLDIDVLGFDYIDPPDREALEDALRQLYVLDALDADGRITARGRAMAALPLDPSLARALLEARRLGCLPEMLTVAGMLSPEGSVFSGGRGPEQLAGGGRGRAREAGGGGGGQGGGQGGGAAPALSPQGAALLQGWMADGLGDHALLLRLYGAWQAAGCSAEWCRGVGADPRALRFARDVRQQLERIAGADGGGLGGGGEGGEAQTGGRAAPAAAQAEEERRAGKRRRRDGPDAAGGPAPATLRALRRALAVGFANRLARRMPSHNGYRTLGAAPALAQVHPSAARLAADGEGLLPEWVVFHELIATGRVFLSGVCPVEGAWVGELLPKLQGVDVARLSGGATAARAAQGGGGGGGAAAGEGGGKAAAPEAPAERRNSGVAVDAARARFLVRKAAAAAAAGPKRR